MTETPLSSAELKQKAATLQAVKAVAPWLDDLSVSESWTTQGTLPVRVVTVTLDLPNAEDLLDEPVRGQFSEASELIKSLMADPERYTSVMLRYRMKTPEAEWVKSKRKRHVAGA